MSASSGLARARVRPTAPVLLVLNALLLLGALALLQIAGPASARAAVSQSEIDQAVVEGGQWLAGKQGASGAIGGFNGDWATTSIAAAGIHAADVKQAVAERSLQDYWQQQYEADSAFAVPSSSGPAQIAKAALIAHSAGLQATRISAEVNLAASLASTYNWETGLFGGVANPNVLGYSLLALGHLGLPQSVAERAVELLLDSQHDDGGWTFFAGGGSSAGDTDMTGIVLAMICSNGMGPGDPEVDAGLAFLKNKQDEASGAIFADNPWVADPNAPTMAAALTGLLACDQDPQAAEWTTAAGKNAIDGAFALRLPSGEFQYGPGSGSDAANNVNATEAMVRALSGNLFSAEPPTRQDPDLPQLRPAPEVPNGTVVPIALSIEDGNSETRLCAVRVPAGTPLVDLLAGAEQESFPADCIEELSRDGEVVTSINGAEPADPSGGWVASVSGGPERRVASQPIGFGDVVNLRLENEPIDVPVVDSPEVPTPHPVPPAITPTKVEKAGTAPVIRAAKGTRRLGGRGRAIVAAVRCPRTSGGCFLVVAKRVALRFKKQKGETGRVVVAVRAPKRIVAGGRQVIRIRAARPVIRRLGGRVAFGQLRVRAVNEAGASSARLPIRVRARSAGR